MKLKSLFFLFVLALTQGLSAGNPVETNGLPGNISVEDMNCLLPPPAILTVDEVGAGWVKVSWPTVAGAAQYQLQVFNAANNAPIGAAVFVPGTANTAQLSMAGFQGQAYVSIWSVCQNNQTSARPTNSEKFNSIILDLVGIGYIGNNGSAVCTLPTAPNCEMAWNGTEVPFQISYTKDNILFYTRNFSLKVTEILAKYHLNINYGTTGNSNEHFYFIAQNPINATGTLTVYWRWDVNQNDVGAMSYLASITCSYETSTSGNITGYISLAQPPASGCTVSKMAPQAIGPADDRLETPNQRLNAIAKPNPFRDALTIQLPPTQDPNGTTLHLYDLLGARKMTYQAAFDQSECTIGTSLLEPGVYFLKIDSGGKMETIKVVKTQ